MRKYLLYGHGKSPRLSFFFEKGSSGFRIGREDEKIGARDHVYKAASLVDAG
jgi:hypothetical protein